MRFGKSPTEITMEVEINAPIEKVWQEFSSIGDIYLNAPTVRKSYLSSEVKSGIGATRHMDMAMFGAVLNEQVIKWEDGTYMALEVFKTERMPGIQTMGGDFGLTAKDHSTVLRSTLNYSMSNSLFGFMNKVIMKHMFVMLWTWILAGYKKHIETGVEVTMKTKLDSDRVKLIDIKQ